MSVCGQQFELKDTVAASPTHRQKIRTGKKESAGQRIMSIVLPHLVT